MVKEKLFMPENQKIPSYFSEFSSKPHFFKVRQSMPSIEMYETKLCNFDAKKNLCTNVLWLKVAILCRKLNLNHIRRSCAKMGNGHK